MELRIALLELVEKELPKVAVEVAWELPPLVPTL